MQNYLTSSVTRRLLLAAAVASVLVACNVEQVAGIQGSGAPVASGVTSVGPITGFGSVFVDGVEYATAGAQIRIDDESATEAQLRVGQIVTIKGSVAAGGAASASEISFTSAVRGPVEQSNAVAGTFTVLGQTVRVTDATLFDESIQPADLSGLGIGTAVQVSAFANAAGELVASRVDVTSATELQVKGSVQSFDSVARTFRINTLIVDYSAATVQGALQSASTVIVRGTSSGAGGTLVATRVQVVGALAAAANDGGRVEGLVTSFVSNSDFTVNGQRVIADSSTELVPNGATLGLDVAVKVRGTFNASGALVATRIEVKPNSASVLRGLVDSVSATNGTLTVLGIPITTGASTSFEDKSSQHVRLFKLSDVRSGDYVEVRAAVTATGNLATLVQRANPEPRTYLQGVASTVLDPSFTVLGVMVATNAQTQFVGLGGQSSASAQFFIEAPGRIVNVRGTVNGGVLIADRVQIRN
jgi:hypothetical protein